MTFDPPSVLLRKLATIGVADSIRKMNSKLGKTMGDIMFIYDNFRDFDCSYYQNRER